jgi:hypothetical protein
MHSVCRNHNPVLSSLMTHYWISNNSTTTVPLVEQELYNVLVHVISSVFLVGFVFLNLLFSVYCHVNHCLSFCPCYFGHWNFCASVYGFWLPLWYLQHNFIDTGCKCTRGLRLFLSKSMYIYKDVHSSTDGLIYMQARSSLYANTQLRAHRRAEKKIKSKKNKINKE